MHSQLRCWKSLLLGQVSPNPVVMALKQTIRESMFLFFHHRTRENGVEKGNHFDDHLTAQLDYPCVRHSCQTGILLEVSSDGEPTLRQNSSFTICTVRKLLPDVQRVPPMLIYYIQSEPTEKNVPLSCYLLCVPDNYFYACHVPPTGPRLPCCFGMEKELSIPSCSLAHQS